jgi:hypothetical protein
MNNILSIRNVPNNTRRIINSVDEFTYVPEKFTTADQWPIFCNLNCYNCTNPIQGLPLFIPADVNNDESIPIERLNKTLYCSPSCVAKVISGMSTNDREYLMRLLRLLIYRITGVFMQMIEPADDRSVMNVYGGNKTRKEYQDKIYLMNREYFESLMKFN